MNTAPVSRLNTEKEEAARLNLSARTLQQWRVQGVGPAFIKLGRAVRYDPAVVDAWLATRARSNTSQPTQMMAAAA